MNTQTSCKQASIFGRLAMPKVSHMRKNMVDFSHKSETFNTLSNEGMEKTPQHRQEYQEQVQVETQTTYLLQRSKLI